MFKAKPTSSVSTALHCGLTLLLGGATAALAQDDNIILGNGTSVTINEYLIETDPDGRKTVVVRAEPNFDPEPYGEVPSDDYARIVQPLCGNLVVTSAQALQEQDISAVRIRWDFTPSKRDEDMPDNMTLTRFHEMVFDIADNAACTPKPLGVGLDNLSPDLSTEIEPTLRWAEPGLTPGELSLTYAVDANLAEIPASELDRAAIELCILHADILLETRARYYSQLYSRTVAITFEQDEVKPGVELLRRAIFPVRDGQCQTGLNEIQTEAIRERQ